MSFKKHFTGLTDNKTLIWVVLKTGETYQKNKTSSCKKNFKQALETIQHNSSIF